MMMNTANNNDFQANAIPNEDLNGARHATTGGDVYTELDNKDDRGMRTDLESTNAIAYGTTPDGNGPTAAPEAHNAAVAKLRNASKAAVLAVMALFGGAGMTSCEKEAKVDPIVITKSEVESMTVDQWIAKNNVVLERTIAPEITMVNKVVAVNGIYKLQPDIRLNKSEIKQSGIQVMSTSGRPVADMHVYINFANNAKGTAEGREIAYSTAIGSEVEPLYASLLNLNSYSNGTDLQQTYLPGDKVVVTCSVQLNNEIQSKLIDNGTITSTNQNNYKKSSVQQYTIGK